MAPFSCQAVIGAYVKKWVIVEAARAQTTGEAKEVDHEAANLVSSHSLINDYAKTRDIAGGAIM